MDQIEVEHVIISQLNLTSKSKDDFDMAGPSDFNCDLDSEPLFLSAWRDYMASRSGMRRPLPLDGC
jgi:hypothetical protein